MLLDRKYIFVLIIIFSIIVNCFSDNSGRTGGNYLKINFDPKNIATGNSEITILDAGAFSVLNNPACIGLNGRNNFGFAYSKWFESTDLGYAGLDFAISKKYALGIGANYISDGIDGIDVYGTPTTYISANYTLLTLGNALSISDNFRIGINVKLGSEIIANYSNQYYMFDTGILYNLIPSKLYLGGEVKNIGGKIGLYEQKYNLPLYWKIGTGYDEKLYTIMIEAGNYNDSGFLMNAGLQLNIKDVLFLRLGYKYQFGDKNLSESMSTYTTGFGIKIKDISLDYALLPHPYLGMTHRLGMNFSFGRNVFKDKVQEIKKEIISDKKPDKNELIIKYTKEATDYFNAGKYDAAIKMWEKVLEIEPENNEAKIGIKKAKAILENKPLNQSLNIAVISFTPQEPVSPGEASFVTEFFRGYLVQSKTFRIVEKQNMDKILAEQGFQQTGCTTQECVIQMGKILNVKMMITGQFGKLISRYILTINLIDIETGEIIYSDKGDCESDRDIDVMVQELVNRLVDKWGKK